MPLFFKPSPEFTIGTEIELQILERESCDLASAAPELFKLLGGERPHIKHELFQSIVEINTGICRTPAEIRRDIGKALDEINPACEQLKVMLASAGTHPFARWEERMLFRSERYAAMAERHRWLIWRLLIFGTHVHIGMRSGDHAIAMMNAWLHYLPHVLAISASSPFWQGQDTGLASCRSSVFESLPFAGHPCVFGDWRDFENYYDAAHRAGTLSSVRDIWWDIRPHPDFGTLEIRVCDAMPTVSETVVLVAFIHALTLWLDRRLSQEGALAPPAYWRMRENKWRASRWGLEAEFVMDDLGRLRPVREEILELIEQLTPIGRELAAEAELGRLRAWLDESPSYIRQRRWMEETRNPQAVAAGLAREFATDRPMLSVIDVHP